MTFTQRVTTITQDKIVPKTFDNYLDDNFLTYRIIANGKKWVGESLKIPAKLAKNTQGGSFAGNDEHSTGTVNVRRHLKYYLKAYEIPVAIPRLDQLVNATDAQVLSLIKTEMESTAMDGADDSADMLYGDGTGNGGKDFDGLANLADDGTVAGSVGTLSRTVWPTLAGYRLASGGLMNLTKLGAVFVNVAGGSASKQRPTLFLSDETRQSLYEQLLTPTVRANYDMGNAPMVTRRSRGAIPAGSFKGGQGFVSYIYRGVPWIADEKCGSDIWALNENYLDWYGLKDPQMQQVSFGQTHDSSYNEQPTKNTGLQFSGMMRPTNQFGDVGHLYLLGNYTCSQPRRQGIFTGVNTV